MLFEKPKFGLALGAGGARGLAHIGVLRTLEAAGIRLHCLAGSSMGALVGAAYAVSRSAVELERRTLDFITGQDYEESGLRLIRDAFNERPEGLSRRIDTWLKRTYLQARFVSRPSILNTDVYRRVIDYFIPEIRIEDLPMPFRAVGTDLVTGRPVLFESGSLRDAVYASSAIPGVVPPFRKNGLRVVDGGVVNMVPVLAARRLGANVVAAVDVEKEIEEDEDIRSAMDVLFRVEDVTNYYLREVQLQEADLILDPRVGHIHWSAFERATEIIQLGKDEASGRLDDVRTTLGKARWRWLRPKAPRRPARDWIVV